MQSSDLDARDAQVDMRADNDAALASPAATNRADTAYNGLQHLFLQRLRRLAEKSRTLTIGSGAPLGHGPTASREWQRVLLKKAIFSTYNDCIALGLEAEALELIRAVGASANGPNAGDR